MMAVAAIVVLVVGLLVSIALHELGHMIPAKKFGVRVSEYFVGFGPTVFSRTRGETEYGLKAIPLGGYVRLVGMVPPADQVKPLKVRGRMARWIEESRAVAAEEIREGEDHRAFYRLTWWRKVIVMAGGPVVNLVIAVALFTVVFSGVGLPGQSTTVSEVYPCTPTVLSDACTPADEPSAAAAAGLQPGDRFVSIDGTPVESWGSLVTYISERPGEQVDVTVERDGALVDLVVVPGSTLRPTYDDAGEPVTDAGGEPVLRSTGFLGVTAQLELQRQPITEGAQVTWQYTTMMTSVVASLPWHLYDATLAALGERERNPEGVMGVVGIGRVAAEVGSAQAPGYGWWERLADQLLLLAGLNLALFVFNMIPLVPLDGGHIASALWQGIKNGWARLRKTAAPRPVDVARMMPVAYGVFALLMAMGVVLIWADIVAPITLTG